MANSRTKALSQQAYVRSTHVNHRMHMDMGFTKNCKYTFQLYMDDHTRESYLDVIKSKADTLSAWIVLKQALENRHAPWRFAIIRTDGEWAYDNNAWTSHCKEEGIVHEFSSRHRHDQNGVIESGMRAIGGPFRSMMIQGNAPEPDIPFALRHSNVIRNNVPTKANNGRSPREKAAGMKLPPNK